MTLLLLFCITLSFTVATQNKTVALIDDILEAIQSLSKDKDVIILPMEVSPSTKKTALYNNETNYEESHDDKENLILEQNFNKNDILFPKAKSSLRWVPKRKKKPAPKSEENGKLEEGNRTCVIKKEHIARITYVMSILRRNYEATSYIFREVIRIRSKKQLIDETRSIILQLEGLSSEMQAKFRPRVLACYKKAKANYIKQRVNKWYPPNE